MLISNYSTSLICLLLICYPALLNCFKLSEPRLLLTYNKGLPSNYSLKVIDSNENECFEWRSSHPNVVSVTPLFTDRGNCSKSAILSSVADLPYREVTDILVYERTTKKKLYCVVHTDNVESIELNSVTDELFHGDSPEKISIIARDKQGHIFSTLSGLEIKWEVNNFDSNAEPYGSDVIKLTRFDISDYESPDESFQLETRGLLSSTLLAQPLQIGRAAISASVLFHGSPVLKTKELQLKVLPNVKLRPNSVLYLMRHAKVNVTLEKFRSGDDNLEFTADVEDTSVADFSSKSELHAKEYGSTSIKIHNQDMESKLDVHVVKVASISFRVSNGNYTILEELKIYEFFIDLFDDEGNMIYASENLRLDVKFPPKLFHIVYTTDNGTYFIVQTTAPGRSKVRAEFKGVFLEDSVAKEKNISVSSTILVSVCQKLTIFPPYTLLPVLNESPMHKITLKVYGGTGNYIWSLNNYEVAKILTTAEENTIEIHIYKEIYDLIVTATDLGNINLINKAQISVQTPNDLEAYPSVVEAEVNNYIIIPVALLGYEDKEKDIIRKFDDCSMLNQIDIVDPYVLAYEKEADIPAFGKGCKSLQFKCRAPGHSRINIEYTLDASKNISYRTTVVLSCFKQLKPVYPVRVSVLALGSEQDVAFDGGPRKWVLFKEGHFTEMVPSNPEIVKIQLIKDPVRYNRDLTVFRVKCLALGETTLTLKIGNQKSATLPHPAKEEASIKLICSEPHSIHLKLFRKKSKQKLDENIVKVPFYGEKTFELDLYAKDKIGRRFANISSLRIVWDTDDKTLAIPLKEFDFESFENAVSGYRKLTRNFMTFKMRGGTGPLRVEAKVTSYRKDVLEKEGIENYKELEGEISTSIDLKLVSLRDLNSDLYDSAKENKDSEEYCESDSCKS